MTEVTQSVCKTKHKHPRSRTWLKCFIRNITDSPICNSLTERSRRIVATKVSTHLEIGIWDSQAALKGGRIIMLPVNFGFDFQPSDDEKKVVD